MTILRRGTACMRIDALRLPDGFKRTLSSQRVREIQKTISAVGILQRPLVREHDNLLIYGTGRVAALVKSGIEDVDVDLVECSDDQVEMLRAIENGARVHSPDQKAKDILKALEMIEANLQESDPKLRVSGSGRSKTIRGEAQRAMAEAEGTTQNAIRQRIHRAKHREDAKKLDPVASIPEAHKPPPIDTLGLELDETWCAEVRLVQQLFDSASKSVREAKAHLVQLRDREMVQDGKSHLLPVRREILGRFLEELTLADTQLRAARPHSLCPMCKGQADLQDHCGTCAGHGWITKSQEKQVDRVYIEQSVVCVGGKPVPIASHPEPEEADLLWDDDQERPSV